MSKHTGTKQDEAKNSDEAIPLPQSRALAASHRGRRKEAVLILADQAEDDSALSELISDWLVPLLVRRFLDKQDSYTEVRSRQATTGLICKEGAGKNRIR